MKPFQKVRKPNGWRGLYLFGRCVFSYQTRRRNCEVCGKGNEIVNLPAPVRLKVFGDRNRVVFEGGEGRFEGSIRIGSREIPVNGCEVRVGRDATANGCDIILMEPGTSVTIGRDCMISWGVEILASDTHAILRGGRVTNRARDVVLGDHVWIGAHAHILKNTHLANDVIVGCGAVVAGLHVADSGALVVGNPARVTQTGLTWDRRTPDAIRQGAPA